MIKKKIFLCVVSWKCGNADLEKGHTYTKTHITFYFPTPKNFPVYAKVYAKKIINILHFFNLNNDLKYQK